MNRRSIFGAEADADVAAAVVYYHQQAPGLEERFLKEVADVLRLIEEYPGGSQRVRSEFRQAPLARFPYVVVYTFDRDSIHVVRVFNTSQHPRRKLRRR